MGQQVHLVCSDESWDHWEYSGWNKLGHDTKNRKNRKQSAEEDSRIKVMFEFSQSPK